MTNKTKRITESAMLIAIAVVLELVGRMVIPPMPFGGQLTLCAMLPIVLISYRHGVKWGLVAGFAYALVQMALGADVVTAAFQPGYFGDGTMIGNAILIKHCRHLRMGQKRLDFGSKQQAATLLRQKQRLHAHSIPCQKESFFLLLPNGKGENAIEPFKAILAPLDITAKQHLCVRATEKDVPRLFKRSA